MYTAHGGTDLVLAQAKPLPGVPGIGMFRKMYIFDNSQQRMQAQSEGNSAVRSVRLVVSQNIFQSKSKSLFQHGLRVKYLPQS